MQLLLLAAILGCVGLTLATSEPLYRSDYTYPDGDDDFHSTTAPDYVGEVTNDDSMDWSAAYGSGTDDYSNRYSDEFYEGGLTVDDDSAYEFDDSSTWDDLSYENDFGDSITWDEESGENDAETLPEENYDDYGYDSEMEYDGDYSWDDDTGSSSNYNSEIDWERESFEDNEKGEPEDDQDASYDYSSRYEDLSSDKEYLTEDTDDYEEGRSFSEEDSSPESSDMEDMYNSPESRNKEDMYKKWQEQMVIMRLLCAKTDAISALFNCTYPRLLQLPAPDYVENSTSTLNRTAFAKAFVEKYTATLSNVSKGGEKQGSYDSDSMETSPEEHTEWCSVRTEYLLMLIKHISLSLRKFPSDSIVDQKMRKRLIMVSYLKGTHILEKEAMCRNRSSWLQHEKKCPLTNLTEPVLDLIRLTYNKSLSFPPASSKNNSTNWLARKLIVQDFLGIIKEMMVQGHHKPGQCPHHLHHHGHGHNQGGRHGRFNNGNYAWRYRHNNRHGPKHHHHHHYHHGHEPSHHHHHNHELGYGHHHNHGPGHGHHHAHEPGHGHHNAHEPGHGHHHAHEPGHGHHHNHEPWHSDSELKMPNAGDLKLERGMGNKPLMVNEPDASESPWPKVPGRKGGRRGGKWGGKDGRKWDGGKNGGGKWGGDKEGGKMGVGKWGGDKEGGKMGVGKWGDGKWRDGKWGGGKWGGDKEGGKKGGDKWGGGKWGGGKRGGGKWGGGKWGGGKGAMMGGTGNGKGNAGSPHSVFALLRKHKQKSTRDN